MTAISKMTREELEAEAARLGIEEPEKVPTAKELRELVVAYAQNASQSADSDNSDVDEGEGDEDAPEAKSEAQDDDDTGDDDADDEPEDEAEPEPVIPEGCVLVRGIGPADRCAYFEKSVLHPNGEVFIAGGQTAIAFRTPALLRSIGRSLEYVDRS